MADIVYGRLVVKNTFFDFEEEPRYSRKRSSSAPAIMTRRRACVTLSLDRVLVEPQGHQPDHHVNQAGRVGNKSRSRRLRRRQNVYEKRLQQEVDEAAWKEYRSQAVCELWQKMGGAYLKHHRKLESAASPRKATDRPVLRIAIERVVLRHVLEALKISLTTLALFMGMGTVRQGPGDEMQLWYSASDGHEPIFEALLREARRFQRARDDNEMVILLPGGRNLALCDFEPLRSLRELKISASQWCNQPTQSMVIKCLGRALVGDGTSIVDLGLCAGAFLEICVDEK